MATELVRKEMLEAYREMRSADMFLSGFFITRPGNINNAEIVSFDIVRGDEEISPVVQICEGPTMNVAKQFTNKEFTPPTITEGMPFNCKELLNRMPGTNEYDASDVGFQAQLFSMILEGMDQLENKIRRNREYQASQIFQDGSLTLQDEAGNDVYTIDYFPKTSHFITVGALWDTVSDPLADIESMADQIRDDSLGDADILIMGRDAFTAFKNNAVVKDQADIRRFELINLDPAQTPAGAGGKLQGQVVIGNYAFNIWTFNGRGIKPGGVTKELFVNAKSVIVMTSSARLDTIFAGVPVPVDVDPRFSGFLPGRIAIPRAVEMSPNIYATQDGREIILEVASRPLLIPTAIDSFGRLTVLA